MREIEIAEAAATLAQLVDGLAQNEEITLTSQGRGVAKLSPLPRGQRIKLGLARGKFTIPDDFDAPLPDDVLALFYEGPIFPEEDPPRS